MQYAIISYNKNQYLVKPGQKITALGELGKEGDIISGVKTLLIKDTDIKVGEPTVDFPVTLKVIEISKTDKVDIFKYRAKSRYRRHTGHRQAQTVLEVIAAPVKVKAAKTASK